jgi:stage II sporulation protein D
MLRHFIYIFFFSLFHPYAALAEQEIRIAIGKPSSQITIKGSGLATLSSSGASLGQQDKITVTADAAGIVVNGKKSGSQIITINSPNLIMVNGGQYRNSLEIKWQLFNDTPQLILIHALPLETYVIGIVSSEVPHSWPLEALKAQAIAARTYAVWQKFRRLDKNYHMESSVLDQVYGGAQREHSLAEQAVRQTQGQILTYDGKPIEAYFHATCGGKTESAQEAWGKNLPYLPGSKCGYCKTAKQYHWTYNISKKNLRSALKSVFPGEISHLKIMQSTKSDRAQMIEISNRKKKGEISATSFRALLGYNNIRSTLIDKISFSWLGVSFSGRGHGHGVGMCQWGAMNLAKAEFSAEKILARYYPGAEIRQLY